MAHSRAHVAVSMHVYIIILGKEDISISIFFFEAFKNILKIKRSFLSVFPIQGTPLAQALINCKIFKVVLYMSICRANNIALSVLVLFSSPIFFVGSHYVLSLILIAHLLT